MEKIRLLPSTKDFVFFVDIRDKSQMYAITLEENQKELKIKENYDFQEKNVPDEFFVNAYKVEKVGEVNSSFDEYDIINYETIKFPINKIEWVFIRVTNDKNKKYK
jgi:hypothetical protein